MYCLYYLVRGGGPLDSPLPFDYSFWDADGVVRESKSVTASAYFLFTRANSSSSMNSTSLSTSLLLFVEMFIPALVGRIKFSLFFPFSAVGFTLVDLSLLAFFVVCFGCSFCCGSLSDCSGCSVLALSLLVWPVVHLSNGCLYFLHLLQCGQSVDACVDALHLNHSFCLVQSQALLCKESTKPDIDPNVFLSHVLPWRFLQGPPISLLVWTVVCLCVAFIKSSSISLFEDGGKPRALSPFGVVTLCEYHNFFFRFFPWHSGINSWQLLRSPKSSPERGFVALRQVLFKEAITKHNWGKKKVRLMTLGLAQLMLYERKHLQYLLSQILQTKWPAIHNIAMCRCTIYHTKL